MNKKELPIPYVKIEMLSFPDGASYTVPTHDFDRAKTIVPNPDDDNNRTIEDLSSPWHVVSDSFDDLAKQFRGLTVCPFCDDFSYDTWNLLRAHIRSKHYQFAVFCLIDNEQVCIIPCRHTTCKVSQHKDGNQRSHYHCPICKKIFARSTAMKGHLFNVKNSYRAHENCILLDSLKVLNKEENSSGTGSYTVGMQESNRQQLVIESTSVAPNSNAVLAAAADDDEKSSSDEEYEVEEQTYEDFLSSCDYNDDVVIEIKKATPRKNFKRRASGEVKSNESNHAARSNMLYRRKRKTPGADVLDIFRMMPKEIETEDQLFAASLSSEMRHLQDDKKLAFKIKTLSFLHELMMKAQEEQSQS